jgi:signal transduction histidine kinase/CheY-like chemotaxis protein
LDRTTVADAALKHVVEHAGAEVGIVYAASAGSRELIPIATYAVPKQIEPVALGDGIPGQAALERQPIFLTDIPPDSSFQIKIGYDQSAPKEVAAVPLLFGDALRGVLVVASLRGFCEEARAFLMSAATQIGIGLQNAEAYEQIERLLNEVREYNEQIQAKNEELQVQNEEIQAQNEEIQSQSEELQSQQEELQAQNEELMQQGEELRRYAAHLAEADDRKNKFLGVLAHELRNPMAPIANSIHILKRSSPGSESALRAQAVIERQAHHLVRLIDDLLDVTRISEGKIHIKKEPIDLVELARVCVEDLAAAFEQADIALDLDLPNAPVRVLGDHTRLCQVLGNLLNNSIKFSNEGGRVQLSLRVDHATGAAVVRVSDEGIGMEPDLLPRLFQPFTQGISGLARTKGGLGLGLSLVKALVALHDGEVSAHSDGAGRGAEFLVRLPLASAKAELQREHATRPLEGESQAAQEVRRLLIIEDNVDAARTLQEALRIEGYDVVVAHSGQQAFEVIATFSPDVVLCDIGLPDMDGHDVARALRANPATASAILIALTGYASPQDKEQATLAGFDLHLAKPLRIAGLQEILAGLKP